MRQSKQKVDSGDKQIERKIQAGDKEKGKDTRGEIKSEKGREICE